MDIENAWILIKTMTELLFFVWLAGCVWSVLGRSPGGWTYNLVDQSDFSVFVSSCYYIVTTLTTVGYGDNTGNT